MSIGPQIERPSVPRRLRSDLARIEALERVPRCPGPWIFPPLLNGWVNAGDPYDVIAYRAGACPLVIEFKGHIMGGASGTVAFILDPAEIDPPTKTYSFLNDIVFGSGFAVARIIVDDLTLEVSIQYPAT